MLCHGAGFYCYRRSGLRPLFDTLERYWRPIPGTDDARTKQAGQQTFPTEFGVVTGIAGNDFYMYVFQTSGITKGTYVGGDVVFSFDTFEEGRGCVRMGMIEQIDDMVVFESSRGRHILENDQIQDIGFGITDDSQ